MDVIWKFELKHLGQQLVEMPAGAMTLCVQMQHGKPCLWARVNPDAATVRRSIITHGTGHAVPDTTGDYIGTYQMDHGSLVFHVFEEA